MLRSLCWCCYPPAEDERHLVPSDSAQDSRPYQQDEGYSSAAGGNTPGSEPFRSAADEEQDILRRILAQTEANIIDVSSAGNERARHAEFVAKIEKYQALLGRAGSSMKRPAASQRTNPQQKTHPTTQTPS